MIGVRATTFQGMPPPSRSRFLSRVMEHNALTSHRRRMDQESGI